MLQATTKKFEALEQFDKALNKIEAFKVIRDYNQLQEANNDLDNALRLDPKFYKPKLFKGILHDLKGEPEKAIDLLKDIIKQVPEDLENEIRFNLGVAFFHRYSENYVLESIDCFKQVVESEKNEEMLLLAKASLAQSYAMMVHHDYRNNREASNNYSSALRYFKEIIGELNSLSPSDIKNSIRWIMNNAMGVANMFYSDSKKHDINLLKSAKKFFKTAEKYSTKNWAVTCNLGSIYMRIADYYQNANKFVDFLKIRESKNFEMAINYLNKVLEDIRPEYDFAYYELGRIYRLQSKFDTAKKNFEMALSAGAVSRNVSKSTLNKQIELCEENNNSFFV